MVACTASLNSLAASYAALGTHIGLATGSPGSSTTPTNEVTGGSPAYARQTTTWSAGSTGVQGGTAVTIDSPAATITYVIVCSSTSGNNMVDNVSVTSVTLSAQGQVVVTPTYTQT
jgi:hypothetical protein